MRASLHHFQMQHDAIDQPDGFARLHLTPSYERELDALTRQLIRTAGVKYVGSTDDSRVMPQARDRFRILAGLAVASVDSGTLTRCTLETVAELTEDLSISRDPKRLALDVIELFTAKLMGAGEAVTR